MQSRHVFTIKALTILKYLRIYCSTVGKKFDEREYVCLIAQSREGDIYFQNAFFSPTYLFVNTLIRSVPRQRRTMKSLAILRLHWNNIENNHASYSQGWNHPSIHEYSKEISCDALSSKESFCEFFFSPVFERVDFEKWHIWKNWKQQ